jgi:hypothetical protein
MYVCIMHQCFGVGTSYRSWFGLTIPVYGWDVTIDFNIKTRSSRYFDNLAKSLRWWYKGTTDGRTYLLTTAPQCPYPDASLGKLGIGHGTVRAPVGVVLHQSIVSVRIRGCERSEECFWE